MRLPLYAVLTLLSVTLGDAATAGQPPQLEVRLQNHLTSYASPPGTEFRCIVIRPYEVDGEIVIDRGSILYGTVVKEQRVGIGFVHERAALVLSFDQLRLPDGRIFPFKARLASIDNAREKVDSGGRIKGILAANNPGNLLSGFWSRPSLNLVYRSIVGLTGASNQVWLKYSMGPIGIAGLFTVRCLVFRFPEPEIYLPPGTDMKLNVATPLPSAKDGFKPPDTEVTQEMSAWVRSKLDLVSYNNGRSAPDLINVALLGSREQISEDFYASGWYSADPHSLLNSSHMYQAFSAMRSYTSAPVSKLLYHGSGPDLVFEKSLNTVTQRHHIRLWRVGVFHGSEVWFGAATHDTGVQFKVHELAFTHKIDPDIDLERDKVVTDLRFMGCSGAPEFLDLSDLSTRQDSRISTDRRLAVLVTQPCVAPAEPDDVPRQPGTKLTRIARRAVLEARNYLERDNTYYWTYRAIRSLKPPRKEAN